MTDTETALLRERVAAWQRAEPALERLRDEELRHANTAEALRAFAGSALWTATHRPPAPTSGLVEQQRWFAKFADLLGLRPKL